MWKEGVQTMWATEANHTPTNVSDRVGEQKMIENLVKRAAETGEWVKEAIKWEIWEPEEQATCKTKKEEMWLWKQLDECDRWQAKLEKWQNIKKSKKIAKAKGRMKVGKEQPSIMNKHS